MVRWKGIWVRTPRNQPETDCVHDVWWDVEILNIPTDMTGYRLVSGEAYSLCRYHRDLINRVQSSESRRCPGDTVKRVKGARPLYIDHLLNEGCAQEHITLAKAVCLKHG